MEKIKSKKELFWKPKFPKDKNNRICFSMLMLAPRYGGKSYMIKHFYEKYWHNTFDNFVVYATEPTIDYYKTFMKYKRITTFVDNEDMSKIRKTKRIAALRKKKKLKPLNVLMIFDDTASRRQRYNEEIMKLYTTGRHYNISIVYTSQAPALSDTVWRENSDILVLFRPNSKKYVDTIIEDVVSGIYPEFVVLKRSAERLKYTQLFLRATNKQYKACVLIYRDRKMFSYRV